MNAEQSTLDNNNAAEKHPFVASELILPEWMRITKMRDLDLLKLISHIKRIHLMSRLLTPGELSPRLVLAVSVLFMELVALLNLVTPPGIRLHVLYLFPLAAIAMHCERMRTIISGLALCVAFQILDLYHQNALGSPLITDALITAASSILTVTLARASRANYLVTISLAATDWLTGLHNRRSFEIAAENEISRQRRYGGVFSLALIDLDGFKSLNDSRGHQTGDAALKFMAKILHTHTRHTDMIARLGGDEFVVLMPNTGPEACLSLSRQLAVIIANHMARAGFCGVTASVGCSSFEEAPESAPVALQRADSAMYAAKANGKACAVRI